MLKDIFLHIKNRLLSGVTEVSDVRIFNSQDDFTDESLPFANNCVFIDFGDISYDQLSPNIELVNAEVIVKLFNRDMTQNHIIDMFDIQNSIDKQLNNFAPWGGGSMHRLSRETDDNFDGGLYVLDTTYETIFKQDLTLDDSRVAIGDWTHTPQSGTTTGVTNHSFSVSGYSSSDASFPLTPEDELAFAFELSNTFLETFESTVPGTGLTQAFTSNGVGFTTDWFVTGPFPGFGFDGSSFYMNPTGSSGPAVTETMLKTEDGSLFSLNSAWFFISNNMGTFEVVPGDIKIHWYRNGVELFNRDFSLPGVVAETNTGFNFIDFEAVGLETVFADEIKVTALGDLVYVAMDELTWTKARTN